MLRADEWIFGLSLRSSTVYIGTYTFRTRHTKSRNTGSTKVNIVEKRNIKGSENGTSTIPIAHPNKSMPHPSETVIIHARVSIHICTLKMLHLRGLCKIPRGLFVCRAGLWMEFWDGGIETVRLESGPPGNEMRII